MENEKILDRISSPEDVRRLLPAEIEQLNDEIRAFLIEKIGHSGGHLASNLGVVELSVALHRVFHTPEDRIIWDVGHQSYVHKILTGRRDRFDTLRQPGGLSGFTRREESEYDPFGAGHSSTSISAAIGFAKADALAGRDRYTVAVIGDGAYTGGMVHEALNNIEPNMKLIIVLNENEMSISRNTGAFAEYIARLRTMKGYRRAKRNTISILGHLPIIGKPLFRLFLSCKKAVKNLLYHSNYFEELGLYYLGPLDGNDYAITERVLQAAKEKGEPVIVHLRTKKGKGYAPAESDPGHYHSVSPAEKNGETFSAAFGRELAEMAASDSSVVAVTAAMGIGTGLESFAERFPDRCFDVGIAEAHALTFSAGLAAAGYKPYAAIYSTFLQRAYDNVVHDIALQRLPVHLMIDRAGLAHGDGATHHGIFDVAFLSHIPNLSIYAPATTSSLRMLMQATANDDLPVAIRYPNRVDSERIHRIFFAENATENDKIRVDGTEAPDILLWTYGSIVEEALDAKEKLAEAGIKLSIILSEKLKPYDRVAEQIAVYLDGGTPIIFLEEGIYDGGAAMILADRLTSIGALQRSSYRILAIRDSFVIPHEPISLFEAAGIDSGAIVSASEELLRLQNKEMQSM